LFRLWHEGCDDLTADAAFGDWQGRHIFIGPTLPQGAPGDLWFDVVGLDVMQRLERSWFSLEPVRTYAVRAFLRVAQFVPQPGSLRQAPAFGHLPENHELRDATGLTQARLRSRPGGLASIARTSSTIKRAEEALDPAEDFKLRSPVFTRGLGEWTSSRAGDETARIALRPATVWDEADSHLDEPDGKRPRMVYDASSAPEDVGFRTAVSVQVGLITRLTAGAPSLVLAEDRTLESVLDRAGFLRTRSKHGG
jgi:hypothetical protein